MEENSNMKLQTTQVSNFGSYKTLRFDFSNLGLTLIHGATGAGKSTLQDIPCWILFGVTAKDGTVDEVRSWQNLDEPTVGIQELEIKDKKLVVTRVRGKAGENDLYWTEEDCAGINRGKDIQETQEFLEKRLGVTQELYIASCYFHEFSSTSTFFTDKAKVKRALFERLACLDLPMLVAEQASIMRKDIKRDITDQEVKIAKLVGKKESTLTQLESCIVDISKWEEEHELNIQALKIKSSTFEVDKLRKVEQAKAKFESYARSNNEQFLTWKNNLSTLMTSLDNLALQVCPTCGKSDADSEKKIIDYKIKEARTLLSTLAKCENPHLQAVMETEQMLNHYDVEIGREHRRANPFTENLQKINKELPKIENAIKLQEETLSTLNYTFYQLSELYNLSFTLRGKLLKTSIENIQQLTNLYLSEYFDAEIKVRFSTENSDNLSVELQKDSYDCSYTQLSKGQRGLLKLCFSIAVMTLASQRAGVHFSTLFFDEALDGLDSDMKVKAFDLFEEISLEHESVLLIDHEPGFQNMFSKKYKVTLASEHSVIEEENED